MHTATVPYTIRITCPHTFTDDINIWCSKRFDKYICAAEVSQRDKEHFHIYCLSDKSQRKLNDLITKELPFVEKGNGNRSVSPVRDDAKAKSYTVKDGQFQFKGFTQDEMKVFVERSFQKNTYVQDVKVLADDIIHHIGTITLDDELNFIQRRLKLQVDNDRSIDSRFVSGWVMQKLLKRSSYFSTFASLEMQRLQYLKGNMTEDSQLFREQRRQQQLDEYKTIGEIVKANCPDDFEDFDY